MTSASSHTWLQVQRLAKTYSLETDYSSNALKNAKNCIPLMLNETVGQLSTATTFANSALLESLSQLNL